MTTKKTKPSAEYARNRRQRIRDDGLRPLTVFVKEETYSAIKLALASETNPDLRLLPIFCGAIIDNWARFDATAGRAHHYRKPTQEEASALSVAILTNAIPGDTFSSRIRASQLILLVANLSTDESGPTITQISEAWKTNVSTTTRAIEPLLKRAVLVKSPRVAHNGAARSSVIEIHRDALANLTAFAAARGQVVNDRP